MTSGKKKAPMMKPLNMPPTPIIQLMTCTNPSDIKPATGIIINNVNKPIINNEIVGVTIISIAFGTILCNLFQLN